MTWSFCSVLLGSRKWDFAIQFFSYYCLNFYSFAIILRFKKFIRALIVWLVFFPSAINLIHFKEALPYVVSRDHEHTSAPFIPAMRALKTDSIISSLTTSLHASISTNLVCPWCGTLSTSWIIKVFFFFNFKKIYFNFSYFTYFVLY